MASLPHHRMMTREPGTKMETRPPGAGLNSPRPSSASSISSKTSTSKSSTGSKTKGPRKEELLKANTELTREVENLTQENQTLKATISSVIDKFIENAKIKGVQIPQDVLNPNISMIPAESLLSVAEKLTAESHKSDTMEGRVEELETRITHLNVELAKLLRTRVNIENGLDELTECTDIDGARQKALDLLREFKTSRLMTFLDSVPIEDDMEPNVEQGTDGQILLDVKTPVKPKPPVTVPIILDNSALDLTPPLKRLPGDTHIKQMHRDLRQYVIQQLSLNKANGADWRMVGDRIGIPAETLNQWRRWKLELPMQYVLQTWSQSPAATVRMLHRHLVSPQLRNIMVAKRINDFYRVD